jgi:hypothetical protein
VGVEKKKEVEYSKKRIPSDKIKETVTARITFE